MKSSKLIGGTRGLHPRHIKKMSRKKTRFIKTREKRKSRESSRSKVIGTGFLVLVAFATVADTSSTISRSKAIRQPSSRALTLKSKTPSTVLQNKTKGEIWYVCTGNTCRSAALKMAAYKNGKIIPTCGSGVRESGGMTPALLSAFNRGNYTRDFLNVAHKHRSQSCNNKCELFKDNNRIFGVVAQSNKKAIKLMAQECGLSNPNIMTLGEIASECKPLENDPWDYSEQAAIEEGLPWTTELQQKQHNVYNNLPNKAEACFKAVEGKLANL